jgi:hypothetical protein
MEPKCRTKASTAEESQIFRGGAGRGLEVTYRLSAIRSERDKKVGELETLKARLASHAAAAEFLEAVRGQLQNLRWQLIEKRKCDARRLLWLLCTESSEHRWKHNLEDFKSVDEIRLRDVPCPDPAAARSLLAEIKRLWNVEPLAQLLDVCEQEQSIVAETADVA